jgi:hypothetical protein
VLRQVKRRQSESLFHRNVFL